MLDLDDAALRRGVTGVSAGNHAISLAYSARILETTAKVVVPDAAPRFASSCARTSAAWSSSSITCTRPSPGRKRSPRSKVGGLVHPFEGRRPPSGRPRSASSSSRAGSPGRRPSRRRRRRRRRWRAVKGGVGCAVKQMLPTAAVYAVEPEGADSLHRSFLAGSPQGIDAVRTIADSLGTPRCEPYSFELNRRFVDKVVLVTDEQIRQAMRVLFASAKLVSEPAGAAALAGVMYPLRGGSRPPRSASSSVVPTSTRRASPATC